MEGILAREYEREEIETCSGAGMGIGSLLQGIPEAR